MTTTTTTRNILLAKLADWEVWYSFIRARAVSTGIWELVNPEISLKPAYLQPPTEPTFSLPGDPAALDLKALEHYKAASYIYKSALAKYERQQKTLNDLIAFIQETITTNYATTIRKKEVHPWDYLLALKQRMTPTDSARKLEIILKISQSMQGARQSGHRGMAGGVSRNVHRYKTMQSRRGGRWTPSNGLPHGYT